MMVTGLVVSLRFDVDSMTDWSGIVRHTVS